MPKFLHAFATLVIFTMLNATSPAQADPGPVILMFGDSLTAGYGLPAAEAVPSRLQNELRTRGVAARVINGGLSGDTTSGGLARLEWVLDSVPGGQPDLVILELGANDALRGIDPDITRRNLDAMLKILTSREIPVLLSGMYAPPNMGDEFGRAFNSIYAELADSYDVPFDPFFLEGVATVRGLNQPDGIHPNAEGAALIAARLSPLVERLLRDK